MVRCILSLTLNTVKLHEISSRYYMTILFSKNVFHSLGSFRRCWFGDRRHPDQSYCYLPDHDHRDPQVHALQRKRHHQGPRIRHLWWGQFQFLFHFYFLNFFFLRLFKLQPLVIVLGQRKLGNVLSSTLETRNRCTRVENPGVLDVFFLQHSWLRVNDVVQNSKGVPYFRVYYIF